MKSIGLFFARRQRSIHGLMIFRHDEGRGLQTADTMPNVPIIFDVLTDSKARALLGLVTTPGHLAFHCSDHLASTTDRLEILQQCTLQLMKDEEYRAEADERPADGPGCERHRVAEADRGEPVVGAGPVVEDLAMAGIKAEE